MDITIPGYITVLPNAIYQSRKTVHPTHWDSRQLLMLSQFDLPSQQSCLQHVRTRLQAIGRGESATNPSTQKLDDVLRSLPTDLRKHFTHDDCGLFIIRTLYPVMGEHHPKPPHYLELVAMTMPSDNARKLAEHTRGADWETIRYYYRSAHCSISRTEFTIKFDEMVLPPWGDIEMLLNHGVSQSRTLIVEPAAYDREHAREVLDTIYHIDPAALRNTVADPTYRIECVVGPPLNKISEKVDRLSEILELLKELAETSQPHNPTGGDDVGTPESDAVH